MAEAIHRAAGKLGSAIVGRARANVSGRVLNRRSGNLLESIRYEVRPSQDRGLEIVVLAGGGRHGVQYAAIHEYGGVILPRNGQFLKFQIDGKWIQTRSVVMPKRPYVAPAVGDVLPLIPKVINQEIRRALEIEL